MPNVEREAVHQEHQKRRAVLMVEDDPQFSKVASRMLELRGYEVRTAPDVPTARQMLGEDSCSEVLMDIELKIRFMTHPVCA